MQVALHVPPVTEPAPLDTVSVGRGYNSQCALTGKATVWRGGTFLQAEALGWPQLQHIAVASLQWGWQPVPSVAGCCGHCCAGIWGGSPPALPWLAPRQPAPWATSPTDDSRRAWTCSQGRACRTMQRQIKVLLLLPAGISDEFGLFSPQQWQCFCKGGSSCESTPSVGCTGAGSCLAEHPQAAMQVGQCHLLLGSPPWQAPPCTAFLTGCGGQHVRAGRQTQREHKYNSGCKGWLRGRVSNRGEDSSVIIYAAQRKELLGSCWQAGRGTKISQALWFKSSGEQVTKSSISATWCLMDPSLPVWQRFTFLSDVLKARSQLQHPAEKCKRNIANFHHYWNNTYFFLPLTNFEFPDTIGKVELCWSGC